MTEYQIGIVGHSARLKMLEELSAKVMPMVINVDDGKLGCTGNHAFIHTRLATEHGWSVILEDDAVPQPIFHTNLYAALEVAPHPIVSLYLGTGYPREAQGRIEEALKAGKPWIVSERLLHAVGYAIAPEIKRELAQWLGKNTRGPGMAPDEAISVWARKNDIRVAYTNPSLVDHRDGKTVMLARSQNFVAGRNRPRKAWNTERRKVWTQDHVDM